MNEATFWSKVDKSGECWLWKGKHNDLGYGELCVAGKRIKAHRFAYQISRGSIPDGIVVCHSCDNPPCVNPAHLWLGTHADNRRDALQKGRIKETLPKLTETQVLAIRKHLADRTKTQRHLADEYGVSKAAVHQIQYRKTWKSV